jgi:hypothetical protein
MKNNYSSMSQSFFNKVVFLNQFDTTIKKCVFYTRLGQEKSQSFFNKVVFLNNNGMARRSRQSSQTNGNRSQSFFNKVVFLNWEIAELMLVSN